MHFELRSTLSFREGQRGGFQAAAQEVRMERRPWGFGLHECKIMNVHVWHGSADQYLPEALAKELATQCRGTFHSLPDKGHAGAWFLCWKQIINEHVSIKADESRLMAVKQAKEAKSASHCFFAACAPAVLPFSDDLFEISLSLALHLSASSELFSFPRSPLQYRPPRLKQQPRWSITLPLPVHSMLFVNLRKSTCAESSSNCKTARSCCSFKFSSSDTFSLCQNGDDFGSPTASSALCNFGGTSEHGTARARASFGCFICSRQRFFSCR
jgi:hypothetical protein